MFRVPRIHAFVNARCCRPRCCFATVWRFDEGVGSQAELRERCATTRAARQASTSIREPGGKQPCCPRCVSLLSLAGVPGSSLGVQRCCRSYAVRWLWLGYYIFLFSSSIGPWLYMAASTEVEVELDDRRSSSCVDPRADPRSVTNGRGRRGLRSRIGPTDFTLAPTQANKGRAAFSPPQLIQPVCSYISSSVSRER